MKVLTVEKVRAVLENNIAIHCPTKEASTALFNLFIEYNYTWSSGHHLGLPTYSPWDIYKEQTCYILSQGKSGIQYCEKNWYINNGYAIISINDLYEERMSPEDLYKEVIIE